MIKLIRENRQKYNKLITVELQDFLYRSKRYEQNFSLAIGYCQADINLSLFGGFTRQTDKFIVLEDNLCCIIFDCAPAGEGIKAATNMLSGFQQKYFGKTLYSSVVCSKEHEESNKIIHQLFDVLEYAIVHNMDNLVVDNEQMLSY